MSNIMFVGIVVLCWLHVSGGMTPVPRMGNAEYVKIQDGDIAFPDELDIKPNSRGRYQMHHHHHYHHHHPDFHHYHYEEEEDEDFEDDFPLRVDDEGKINSNGSMQIPLEFIQNINKYNVSDLLLNFIDEGPSIQERFGDDGERDAAVMPKEAGCMPELKTIRIATSDDPSILYIPQCTRIERCGGCCSHALLACQPQETESISYKVIKTQYTGGKKLKLVAKELVAVEKHTKCKCDCRVKPEDCNKFQEYRKSECRCACMNFDEEKKCYKNNQTKLWNPDVCACQCRETMECSTGSYFDQNECKCAAVSMKRRYINYGKINYKSAQSTVPLDEDD